MTRIEDLLSSLSLEQKVAQLSAGGRVYEMDYFSDGEFDEEAFVRRFPHGTGQLGRPSLTRRLDETSALTTQVQEVLRDRTTTGLPALFNEEGVHGLMGAGATVFPSALALAATWDVDLVEQVYEAVAVETRARGSNYVYAPVLDLARDPRWGRVEETFGEHPTLVAEMGVAAVLGLQGRDRQIPRDRVLACAKHFVGHGIPQAGLNGAPVQVGYRELRSEHVIPFEAVTKRAEVGAVMVAYHDWDGLPTHANRALLVDLLRNDLGFEGMVTSDGYGIAQLHTLHKVVPDLASAARSAFSAGVDCEVPEPTASTSLVADVRAGLLSQEVVDRACRRVLEAKDRLGLLDEDRPAADQVSFDRGEHAALSQLAAERGLVLLTNNGVLPAGIETLGSIAVLGPNAHTAHMGGYTDPTASGLSVLEGIREVYPSAAVTFGEGCRITDEPADASTWWANHVELADPSLDDARIEQAVAAARDAHLAVVVVGGSEATHREGWWFDHLGDRATLNMAGRQDELVERVAATGTTTVAVVISGGPVDLRRTVAACDAVIWTCYPGERGGLAVARVIAGLVEPGGRLPITFPRSEGQIPLYHGMRPSAARGYLHSSADPLFAFGQGLGYTRFEVSDVELSRARIGVSDLHEGYAVTLDVVVRNVGERPGSELVRLHVTDEVSSVATPRSRLIAFGRVKLEPGESGVVRLSVGFDSLRILDRKMEWVVEPGDFALEVATGEGASSRLTLVVVDD